MCYVGQKLNVESARKVDNRRIIISKTYNSLLSSESNMALVEELGGK
jgi:hypothetical protein